jgi:serine/threonine-protein kinase
MPSTREDRLEELLQQWHGRRQRGEMPTPEDLCQEYPELADQLRERLSKLEPTPSNVLHATSTLKEGSFSYLPDHGEESWPVLDGYEILGRLGKGGMGIVYKARQLSLNRIVAIKVLQGGVPTAEGQVKRFRREAEALARLQHPHIVQIHDVQEQAGRPFIAMEFVAGGNLSDRLAGEALSPRDAAGLVVILARAMHAAHQAGVIHRDLKPSNILLAKSEIRNSKSESKMDDSSSDFGFRISDSLPKIADFGLAKSLEGDPQETPSGVIIGTPCYISPEQAASRKDVGPAADVYSLGAILYECLTARPPFRADTPVATISDVLSKTPMPVRRLQPSVPRALEAICLKCLEKAPQDRYFSAAELADDLDLWLAGKRPVQYPSAGRRVLREMRRPRSIALAGILILVLAVLAVLLRERPREQEEQPVDRILKQIERGEAVTLVPERGPPAWWSWVVVGESSAKRSRTEPFSVSSFSNALVELLPRVPARGYRISLEVRQDEVVSGGYVGIYFGLLRKNGEHGPEYFYYQLIFSDDHGEKKVLGPRLEFRRLAENGPRGPVDVHIPLLDASKLSVQPEKAATKQTWRKLSLEVSARGIKAWEGTTLLEEYSLDELEKQLSLFRKVQGIAPDQPLLPVQGGVGLCVNQSGASFRSVVVTPLGER